MEISQILRVLRNERECIHRQGGSECKRNCDPIRGCTGCDLLIGGDDILEVYDFLINGYELLQKEGAEEYTIRVDMSSMSEEDFKKFKEQLRNSRVCTAIINDSDVMRFPEGICVDFPGKESADE